MDSGISCNDKCVELFNDIKLKKNYRYILYKIENQHEIIVDKCGDKSQTMEDFKKELEAVGNDARYAVLDYEQDSKTSLIFIIFLPGTANVRIRMLYTCAVDALKRQLVGVRTTIAINDLGDVNDEHIKSYLAASH